MLKIKHEWWKYFSVAAALLPTRERYFSSSSQPCYERAKLKKHRAKVGPAFTTVGQQTANCSQTSWPCVRWASWRVNLIWKQTKTGKRRTSLCLTSQNCHSFRLWRWCWSAPTGHCWESLRCCRWFFGCSLAERKSGFSKKPQLYPQSWWIHVQPMNSPLSSFLVWSYAPTTPAGGAPPVHIYIYDVPPFGD